MHNVATFAHPQPIIDHKHTVNNGQLMHMHTVGGLFHNKASTWKGKHHLEMLSGMHSR